MKKVLPFLFVALISLPVAGSYLYFFARLNHIRREMRAKIRRLPDDCFERLTLTSEEYEHAREGEDEIEFRGKMYDVARIEFCAGQVIVYGLHDEAEDNLLVFLHEVFKRASQDENKIPLPIYQFLTLAFLSPATLFEPTPVVLMTTGSTQYLGDSSVFEAGLDTPPPRS